MTKTFKILSRLYLGNCKVYKVYTWQEYLLGDVDLQSNDVTLI